MARTPLFDVLRRAAVTAAVAERQRLPLDELVERRPGLSGRRFLQQTAIAGADMTRGCSICLS